MKFLVTGANGFLGRRVAESLLAEGRAVRALVRSDAKGEALRARGAEVTIGDLVDADSIRRAVKGTDVVLHCGAAIGPQFSGDEQFAINVNGVRNVFEAVVRDGRQARVVCVSSAMVLGTRNLDPATDFTEPQAANDPGADSKLEAERVARKYISDGVSGVIVRPPLIYGAGDPYNVPKFARQIETGVFRFVGSRENVVPIVHIDDIARAVILAGLVREAPGPVYNVTDGSRTTAGQFFDRIAECLGRPAPTKVVPFLIPRLVCAVSERLGGAVRITPRIDRVDLRFLGTSRYFDISRASADLGYVPRVGYADGIAESVDWYRTHAKN